MMAKIQDQHLHSRHSFDSKSDPRANVEQAIARGLAGLIFTEHFDTHPDDWPTCVYDEQAYSDTMESLRQEFGDRLFIGKGIEVCYQPDQTDRILELLDNRPFDMVMISVHYFHGHAVHIREHWRNLTLHAATEGYLRNVLDAVEYCNRLRTSRGRVFDVLGHLDVIKRYTNRFLGAYDVSVHGGLMDEILGACIEADLVLEINTSSLRQGLQETMPGCDTIRRYAALGGTAVSLGSDAHQPGDIGAGFDRALQMVRDAGLKVARFAGRQRTEVAA